MCDCFEKPFHWNLLSDSDAHIYLELRDHFNQNAGKSRKGERLDSFTERLDRIRSFVDRDDEDCWKRSLVCGICFLPNALALNIQQFRKLIGKCKSSINGSLQQLGYTAQPPAKHLEQLFRAKLPPNMRDNGELKKWSFRFKEMDVREKSPPPFVVPLPLSWASQVNVESEAIEAELAKKFPCPVKWRYKFWDTIRSSVSCQTEV
jgi:hypothetical protein